MRWLEILVTFNTVINLIVLYGVLRRDVLSRFEFKLRRTFWLKKPYGWSLLLWHYPRHWHVGNRGKCILGFNWINPKWLNDNLEEKRRLAAERLAKARIDG